MTSNVGAQLLQRQTSMGFPPRRRASTTPRRCAKRCWTRRSGSSGPSSSTGISDIVFFRPLDKSRPDRDRRPGDREVRRRLVERKINLELTPEAKALLIEKGYDEKYGARPLRRAVEHYLEDPLAEAILRGEVKEGESVLVARDGEVLNFKQKTPPATTEVAP